MNVSLPTSMPEVIRLIKEKPVKALLQLPGRGVPEQFFSRPATVEIMARLF